MINDERAAVARNKDLAIELLSYAGVCTTNISEQAGALLTAATVLIERECGPAMASAALTAMLMPTVADWQRKTRGTVGEC